MPVPRPRLLTGESKRRRSAGSEGRAQHLPRGGGNRGRLSGESSALREIGLAASAPAEAIEQAATVFLDARLLSQLDEDHGEDEERWLSLKLDKAARLLVVSHTYRDVAPRHATIRIISARRATRPETKTYEESKP